jgi:hypothetical protein
MDQNRKNNHQGIKLKVAMNSIGIRSSAKGKAVNYCINRRGKWRRCRADMGVSVAGVIFDSKCKNDQGLGTRKPVSGFKKRKELKNIHRFNSFNFKTKKAMLGSIVDFNTGTSFSLILQ